MNHDIPFAHQAVIFELTFVVLGFANAITYALVASRARRTFASPRAIKIFNRTGGSLLMGAGLATVAIRS